MDADEIRSACASANRAYARAAEAGEDTDGARRRVLARSGAVRRLSESYPMLFDMAFSDGFREEFLDEMLAARAAVAKGQQTYHDASVRIGEAFKSRFVDPVIGGATKPA